MIIKITITKLYVPEIDLSIIIAWAWIALFQSMVEGCQLPTLFPVFVWRMTFLSDTPWYKVTKNVIHIHLFLSSIHCRVQSLQESLQWQMLSMVNEWGQQKIKYVTCAVPGILNSVRGVLKLIIAAKNVKNFTGPRIKSFVSHQSQ